MTGGRAALAAVCAVLMASDDHFHTVFQAQFHLLQCHFEGQILHIQVRLFDELLKLGFTAGMFFGEVSKLNIVGQQGLSYVV
jgi:hypothetical protein